MFGIVIDKQGYKVAFTISDNGIPLLNDMPRLEYELKDGETFIEKDYKIANLMNKPQWQFDKGKWIDTDPLPPVVPEPQEPNQMEVLLNELSEALLEAELRAVENEVIINETSNYVLDLDERLTNIELKK